jgi:hypothetical protein
MVTMPRIDIRLLVVGTLIGLFAGCDMTGGDEPPPPAPKPYTGPRETSIRGEKAARDPTIVKPETQRHDAVSVTSGERGKPASDAATQRNSGENESPFSIFNSDAKHGFDAITAEIADLLKVKKTLVVWLLDKTPSSVGIRGLAMQAIPAVSRAALNKARPRAGASNPLSIAIVGYGKEVAIVTPEPIDDLSQAGSLASGIGEEAADSPLTFTAVSQAAEQFLPYRSKGYEVIFVIAADSNGRDWDKLDEAIPKLARLAVPVYGVGNAIPFGREAGVAADKVPSESFALERIDLAYPGRYSEKQELSDSGYGPFGLERLCRKTRGRFYRIRFNNSSPGWNTASDGTVDSKLLADHAPDYVSENEYKKLLSENKARIALVNAAKVSHADVLGAVGTQFRRQTNEATLVNMVTNAQRGAAEKSLDVDRIYATLAPGESDRPKLTGARWQAEFDLAMGRILAAKSRIDGYNNILAMIKQGKAFGNPTSEMWVLTRADGVSGSSVLNKNAENARMYLNRVIKEHPGTPWAVQAEHELEERVGWELSEQ